MTTVLESLKEHEERQAYLARQKQLNEELARSDRRSSRIWLVCWLLALVACVLWRAL